MTSFTEDMRPARMQPGQHDPRARGRTGWARLGRFLHVSPSERIVVAQAAPAGRSGIDGDRDAARPRERSFPA